MTSPPDERNLQENVDGAEELEQHFVYISRAYHTTDTSERRQALIDGLLNFGTDFVGSLTQLAGNQGLLLELKRELQVIFFDWLYGEYLTNRLDEDERRAQVAASLLLNKAKPLECFAARSLLALPEGHHLRDTKLAHETLRRHLEEGRARGDVDAQIQAINYLIEFELEAHERTLELISEGRALIGRTAEAGFCHDFQVNVIGYYCELARNARAGGRMEECREWAGKARESFERLHAEEPNLLDTAQGLNLAGAIKNVNGQAAEAAAMFALALEMSAPHDGSYENAAFVQSRRHMMRSEYEHVVKILAPLVPALKEKYLAAVEDDAVATAGNSFAKATEMLAFAYAHLNLWDEAVKSLEWGKSLRQRYHAALRRSPEGKSLLELEAKLYALSRGVPLAAGEFDISETKDRLGAKVSLRNKVLEAYRKQRPLLSPELLGAPAAGAIARTLEADEAVIVIGVTMYYGMLVAVICHGDEGQPSGRFLLEDWPLEKWLPLFAGDKEDGWIYALGAPELELDQKSTLLRLLDGVDKVIGQTLQPFLRERKVDRLTVIPHRWFHFVPFQALPSLEGCDVMMAASAAHFIESRQALKPANRRALVVGADTTQDLLGSLAEADAVTQHLAQLGFDVTRLEGEQATEDAVVAALHNVSVFHFCGHGRSDIGAPSRSALLLWPQPGNMPVAVGGSSDPFAHYATTAQDWQAEEEEWRSVLIPGGRLYERLTAEGQPLERRIEYGGRGSLWGYYQDGQLTQLAEMWTAGDILIDSTLSDCCLAFLSACEVGSGSIKAEADEYAGLPAALQLAGVATVVCSLWPIDDALTALYVDLFYRALAEAPQPVNVAKVVRHVREELRRMKRERAVVLLNRLERQTASPEVRFFLEGFAAEIAVGDEYPFSHPYNWAAFYATGTNRILFTKGDVS